MNTFFIALAIGIVAGIIDVVTMIIQKIKISASVTAFAHWIVIGILVPYVNWDITPWAKGLLVALLMIIPPLIMIYPQNKKALFPMVLSSIVLGAGVGVAGSLLIG